MNNIIRPLVFSCLLFLPLVGHAVAVDCFDDPLATTGHFVGHSNGTVSDGKTGLLWKRCQEGQSWDGSSCNGIETQFNWADSFSHVTTLNNSGGFEGYNDWRVPNVRELMSIIEWRCGDGVSSRVNTSVFPNLDGGITDTFFWTSSLVIRAAKKAIYLDLPFGIPLRSEKRFNWNLLLVRDSNSELVAKNPTYNACDELQSSGPPFVSFASNREELAAPKVGSSVDNLTITSCSDGSVGTPFDTGGSGIGSRITIYPGGFAAEYIRESPFPPDATPPASEETFTCQIDDTVTGEQVNSTVTVEYPADFPGCPS